MATEPLASRRPLVAFEGFTFDSLRGVLTAEAREIVLRPKTAAVLEHLLAHAGQVMSRDTLLTAVWGDIAVTDDSLTQCISEIRRALGPGAAELLQTHARRGYRMAATPRPVAPAPAEPAPAPEAPKPATHPHRSRVAWAALVIGACGLSLAAAALLAADRASGRVAPVAIASGELSSWAQARQLLTEGRIAQQGSGPYEARLRASLALFLRALELDPNLAEAAAEASFAHTNLRGAGISRDPDQDLREAERLATLAMAAGPDEPMSLGARAAVLRQQNRFAEALVFYERAGADPGRVVDRANAGQMYLMMGDAEAALPRLSAALLERPLHEFSANWQVMLGLARLMTGQPDQAAEDFQTTANRQSFFRPEERLFYRLAALQAAGRSAEAEALNANLRQRDPALTARPLEALLRSNDATYRARFDAAVLEPLRQMGWTEIGR